MFSKYPALFSQHPGPVPKGLEFHLSITEKHNAYILWMGPLNPELHVCHPNTAKQAVKMTESKPLGFAGFYSFLLPWIGMNLYGNAPSGYATKTNMLAW